jgi:magnesium chelatase family protein
MKRYLVNLAPAEMRKEGPAYDLPIAMGVLAATEQIPAECLENTLYVGELSLDGTLRHVRGVMSFAYLARELGYTTLYVPDCDAAEAALVDGIDVIPVSSLGHLVEHVFKLNLIPPYDRRRMPPAVEPNLERLVDYSDVKGQEFVKRAMEIVATGGHHALLSGALGDRIALILSYGCQNVNGEPVGFGHVYGNEINAAFHQIRTFAWLGNCRRLSKDYEEQIPSSEGMIYLASIRTLLKCPSV